MVFQIVAVAITITIFHLCGTSSGTVIEIQFGRWIWFLEGNKEWFPDQQSRLDDDGLVFRDAKYVSPWQNAQCMRLLWLCDFTLLQERTAFHGEMGAASSAWFVATN